MATTIQEIQSLGDDNRRDSTSSAVDTNKKMRAINSVLQSIHAFTNWDFTKRQKEVNTFQGITDYSIPSTIGITDFKNIADLRFASSHTSRFLYVDSDEFDVRNGNRDGDYLYTIERKYGEDVLRVNIQTGKPVTEVSQTSSLTANGTWAAVAGTDATNVTLDTLYRDFGGVISFDLDTSLSANNYGEIDVTMSIPVDLSQYDNYGTIFAEVEIPSPTYISGFTLLFGTDSSNYYSASTTTNSDGGGFVQGLNRIKFEMNGAAETGSVTASSIAYINLRVSYTASQPSDTGFKFCNLNAYAPEVLELLYYSSAICKNSSGVWQLSATSTSDQLIIPDRFREVVVNGYTANLLGQMGKLTEMQLFERRFNVGLTQMAREFGIHPNTKVKGFRPAVSWRT